MDQKPMSIYEFKKGDRITRIKPSKPIAKLQEDEIVSRDYIGTPLIFVCIANGCIYLKRFLDKQTAEMVAIFNMFSSDIKSDHHLIHLELDLFDEGWSYYIDPLGLDDKDSEISIKELERQKEKALEEEDYLKADRLQKKIKDKRKKK